MTDSFDLVVDTSRRGIAMGLYPRDRSAERAVERIEPAARGEMLDSLLGQLLHEADLKLHAVERVLVTLGPGSFTGLRTGIAFCEGLCITGERTLHGVSTLKALTTLLPGRNAQNPQPGSCAVIYRARPGYWYMSIGEKELFIETAQAESLLESVNSCVADAAAWNEPAFAKWRHQGWVQDPENQIAPFASLLDWIPAGSSQRANYIQDSYFEKKSG